MRTFKSEPPISLKDSHRRFAECYVVENNGTAAARAAGYAPSSAKVAACRLRQRKDIQAHVKVLRAELEAERTESAAKQSDTAEFVIEQYRHIASVLPSNLMIQEGGRWRQKRPDELTDAERTAIAAVTIVPAKRGKDGVVTGPEFKYRLYSRKLALDALSRIQDLNKAVVEHEHRHDVGAEFSFEVGREATRETRARLRARYDHTGARITDVTPQRSRRR